METFRKFCFGESEKKENVLDIENQTLKIYDTQTKTESLSK